MSHNLNSYMFDTNIFGKFTDGKLDPLHLSNNIQLFCTHIQKDEIEDIRDTELRQSLLDIFKCLQGEQIPTETFVLGKSRLDIAKLGDGETFNKLQRNKQKETEDALIGEACIKNKITLVTGDGDLVNLVKNNGCSVLHWDDFKPILIKSIASKDAD